MRVFVVIATHNPKKWIKKCFDSLRLSTITLKTIVIDNNSKDGSQLIIKSNYPDVEFISLEKNIGFGAANNIGIRKAYDNSADYVFLLNQDAWIETNTLEKLISISKIRPEFGILSPMHYNGFATSLDYNFSTFIAPDKCNGLLSDIVVGNRQRDVYKVKFVNAAAWLITRNCINIVGGFNPSFYHYAEDLNYVERLYYHKFEIGVVPSVKIFHDRQLRKSNSFLLDKKIVFKRTVIRELSKPIIVKSLKYFYFKILYNILKSFLFIDFKKFKKEVINLKILFSMNISAIYYNRELSLKRGLTFLKELR